MHSDTYYEANISNPSEISPAMPAVEQAPNPQYHREGHIHRHAITHSKRKYALSVQSIHILHRKTGNENPVFENINASNNE
jgi:hypothetical protein